MQSNIAPMILFNLILSFVIPNISIGNHIGKLIGNATTEFTMEQLAGRQPKIVAPIATCVIVGAIAITAAITVSKRDSPFAN